MKSFFVSGIIVIVLILTSCKNVLVEPCQALLAPYSTREQFNLYVQKHAAGKIEGLIPLTEEEAKTRKKPFEIMEKVIIELIHDTSPTEGLKDELTYHEVQSIKRTELNIIRAQIQLLRAVDPMEQIHFRANIASGKCSLEFMEATQEKRLVTEVIGKTKRGVRTVFKIGIGIL